MTQKSDEQDLDFLEGDFGFEEEGDRTSADESARTINPAQSELLTLKLLKASIQSQNPDDPVMLDFAKIVLPHLLTYTIGVTAKGGKFFAEYLDRVVSPQRIAEGKAPLRRAHAADQSLNTHLLNGLFPANLIERRLSRLNTTVKRQVKEQERRLLIAGFILHDFEKFDYALIPGMAEGYRAIRRDPARDIRKQPVEAHREIVTTLVKALALDRFVCPDEADWQQYLDDLLYIAYNTQQRSDTNLNLSGDGLNPVLSDRTLSCLSDLTCLADRLASIIKHPKDAQAYGLAEIIHKLSDGQLRFTYHAISENRGVLTNVVNNALMDAHTNLNSPEEEHYFPLLYLPTGVIYLTVRAAPPINPAVLPDRVVASIKSLCAGQLRLRQTGFSRDGKGMKYADYYSLFFDTPGLMEVALDATRRILNPTKGSVASKRSENLVAFQQKNVLSADYDFKFGDDTTGDIRIDQLAEFGDLISRKIWGEQINQLEKIVKERAKARKKQKDLPELPDIPADVLPASLIGKIAESWQLSDYLPQVREIQRINETLKSLKLKGNTGGVPYEWYFLAAKFLEKNPGIEDLRETCQNMVAYVTALTQPVSAQYEISDGWDDIRLWVGQVVMLPEQTTPLSGQADIFLKELAAYSAAKKSGRGRQLICSISHSPYSVSEQMESAVLFTPQVYTNKQHLGGSNAKRNISSIAGIEMMLRQILMNQTQAVGKRFEDGKYRYLYFYPTYYFTPETNAFLHKAYSNIAQTRFDTSIRNHFVSKSLEADFSRSRYQTVDAFLMDEELEQRKQLPADDPNFKRDRTFKLTYPDDKPLTFYFMALPPGRDSTDTESWVMPSWLALTFPMILDVKTVVSESPIPPFTDGAEFEESVFLDSAPQAFRTLVGQDRFRLDAILEGWTDASGLKRPAPLNTLTAAYAIHMDVNAKQGKNGYDANWGKLTEFAKDIETSPLYVFSYLAKWSRGQKADAPSPAKIRLYAHYFYPCFDPYATYSFAQETWNLKTQSALNHPKKLTDLYRSFYRANKAYNPKANAVLKPVDIASETILKAESTMFQGDALISVVAAEVFKLMDRVHNSTAEGRWVVSDREKERQLVLDFARYFVVDVFEEAFSGDRARLAGRQINLIRDTCEFLYRLEQDKENQERQARKDSEADEAE